MSKVEIFGIVNLTPNSVSGDGVYYDVDAAELLAAAHFANGADYVDIGAESTKPGADPISTNEEWLRLKPVLDRIVAKEPHRFSIDTHHAETVRKIYEHVGAVIINDVTGMNDPEMRSAVAEYKMPVIISHLPASVGQDIQKAHREKPITDVQQIKDELLFRVEQLMQLGMNPNSIILDPGFGFGKQLSLNPGILTLPTSVPSFEWMLGVSRKGALKLNDYAGKELLEFRQLQPEKQMSWLDQRSVEAAIKGVSGNYTFLRVHNVAAHVAALAKVA